MAEPHDRVDRDRAAWARVRPEVDMSRAAAVERLRRVAAVADRELDEALRRYGLSRTAFDLLAALRRLGRPDQLLQSELLTELAYTSGTLSVRLGRLERAGLISRTPDPADRRGVIVALTDAGRALVDAAAPAYAAAARRLLEPLGPAQRESLTGLLRVLLSAHEVSGDTVALLLGVVLVPPSRARRLRRSVGLTDRPGVLVGAVERGGPAERAGLARGDLIVAAGRGGDLAPVEDAVDLGAALSAARGTLTLALERGGRELRVTVDLAG